MPTFWPGPTFQRDCGEIGLGMRNLEHEALVDDDMVRIAAEGVTAEHGIGAVIRADEPGRLAILLLAIGAGRALAAAVDHAADAGDVADLELGDVVTDRGDSAHDLMARDARIQGAFPLALGGMEVRMADAAERDVDRDVGLARRAAFEAERCERSLGRLGGVALGGGGHAIPKSDWQSAIYARDSQYLPSGTIILLHCGNRLGRSVGSRGSTPAQAGAQLQRSQ
jgi:hypothetical protein